VCGGRDGGEPCLGWPNPSWRSAGLKLDGDQPPNWPIPHGDLQFPSRFVAKASVGTKLGVAPQQSARRGRLSALISVSCHDAQTLAIAVTRHRLSFVTLPAWRRAPNRAFRERPEPPRQIRPARGDSLAGADFEYPAAAHGARAFGRWPTILHRDRLGIRDLARGLAFHSIAGGWGCGFASGSGLGHRGVPPTLIPAHHSSRAAFCCRDGSFQPSASNSHSRP